MDSRNAIFSPTNADFEAFPPTVKRKYFSTLERLRYAQGQVPDSSMNSPRPKTSSGSKYSFGRFQRSSNRPTKDIPPDMPVREVTEAESAWFQSLPEKIKRNHFTFEERHHYAGSQETHHVVDATEELFYKLGGGGRHANRSLPSLSSNSDEEGDDSTFDEVIDTPLDSHDSTFEQFQELDSTAMVDSDHDDYHTHVTDAAQAPRRPSTSNDSPSLRKRSVTNFSSPRPHMSLDRGRSTGDLKASQPFIPSEQYPPRSSSITAVSMVSAVPSSKLSLFERRASRRFGVKEEDVPPVPTIDPEAAHVSDPATRLKLKLYLGSAAKFDEALEFGFPTTATHEQPASARSTHRRGSLSSVQARRRSQSVSTTMPGKRESVMIGTTFFMDDDEDLATVDQLSPVYISDGLETPSADADVHTFYAELPADSSPHAASRPDITTPHTAPAHVERTSTFPVTPHARQTYRSQSISLRPRQQLALDTDMAQHHNLRPLMSAREKPLKPWVEPADSFGDREMTLRMTLTRKDLRADENLIYPENGTGSWDAMEQDTPTRSSGDSKRRFWQRWGR